jgi:hypothetical protein
MRICTQESAALRCAYKIIMNSSRLSSPRQFWDPPAPCQPTFFIVRVVRWQGTNNPLGGSIVIVRSSGPSQQQQPTGSVHVQQPSFCYSSNIYVAILPHVAKNHSSRATSGLLLPAGWRLGAETYTCSVITAIGTPQACARVWWPKKQQRELICLQHRCRDPACLVVERGL